jgi:hypothetical protein
VSGWDDVEPNVVVPDNQQRDDLDIVIARTFSTENGQRVLAWLREAYLENPSWQPGAEPSYGFYREGQNAVIRDIEKRIKRIKE